MIMASPGMMQTGLSRQLFEAWCTDRRNGVIVAGYCVEGTLAKVCGLSLTLHGLMLSVVALDSATVLKAW